jgi:hypothetical protein
MTPRRKKNGHAAVALIQYSVIRVDGAATRQCVPMPLDHHVTILLTVGHAGLREAMTHMKELVCRGREEIWGKEKNWWS